MAAGRQDLEGHPGWIAWDAWAVERHRDRLAAEAYIRPRVVHLALVLPPGDHDRRSAVPVELSLALAAGWKALPAALVGAEAGQNRLAVGRSGA